MIGPALVFLGTLLVGIPACRAALRFARRRQIIDHPNWRSSHTRPTPRGGGLGIVATLLPAGAVAYAVLGSGAEGMRAAAATGIGVVALAGLGYRDDRADVGPAVKFPIQAAVAAVGVIGLGAVDAVALPGGLVGLGALGVPLTFLFLAGFPNAYNFMDGIDGIAAVFGAVSALFLYAAALAGGGGEAGFVLLPVAGACVAFLPLNRPPARIFMGDVGSLPVGYALAAGGLLAHGGAAVPFVTVFLALGPFLFDTSVTLARRAAKGENLLAAHRSHLYQRLVVAGLTHGQVTLLYGGWTVLTGSLGLVYLAGGTGIRAAALFAALLSGLGVWSYAVRLEGRQDKG